MGSLAMHTHKTRLAMAVFLGSMALGLEAPAPANSTKPHLVHETASTGHLPRDAKAPRDRSTACEGLLTELNYSAAPDFYTLDVAIEADLAVLFVAEQTPDGPYEDRILFYRNTQGTWAEEARIDVDSIGCFYFPRRMLSISGDRVIVSLPGDCNGSHGEARIYHRLDGQWLLEATLQSDNPEYRDMFGISVAISGDAAVVGAPQYTPFGRHNGSAHVFRRVGRQWVRQDILLPDDGPHSGASFGVDVTIDDNTILAGSLALDTLKIFTNEDGHWQASEELAIDGVTRLARSVDLDGPRAVIGSRDEDGNGRVHVLHHDGMNWAIEQELSSQSNDADPEAFGHGVRLQGSLVSVTSGTVSYDDPGDVGFAELYQLKDGQWAFLETIAWSDLPASYWTAPQADLSGNQLIIAAPNDLIGADLVDIHTISTFDNGDDCNGNGLCDELDIASFASRDCNGNGVPDDCDLADGLDDVDGDGVLDACEADCDADGWPDDDEIAQGFEPDCNDNGVPDSCDIAQGTSPDSDDDGSPDECHPLIPLRVAADGSAFFDDIQSALNVALPTATIMVGPGTYHGPIVFPDHPVALISEEGPGHTSIVGDRNSTVVRIQSERGTSDHLLDGFTLTGADVPWPGGGLLIRNAAPTISNCVFRGNRAPRGGGACVDGSGDGTAVFIDCRFHDNVAFGESLEGGSGGGLAITDGQVSITRSVFLGNQSAFTGGGLVINESTVQLDRSEFRYNTSELPGGGVMIAESTLDVSASTFCGHSGGNLLGPWNDLGGTIVSDECDCTDADGDGIVDSNDILAALENWGDCPGADCPADVNLDGVVDVTDVLMMVAGWGPCDT
ncbi:MAG: hypothetical protein MK116_09650 [Phycisphaerales bacterium]|nr:hypothetical protein [Phycisphaerales bacterium]